MQLPDQFAFLSSSRFWAIVIAGLTAYAQQKGWIGTAELALIGTITGGFTVVRTVDRHTDKMSE